MHSSLVTTSLPPDSICGYTVLRSPSVGSYIALASNGRQVFLKPLDTDCLLHGQLHPSIKERLACVRELALKSTANLHGVELDEHGVFLVWEYIDGDTLEAYLATATPGQFNLMMREVTLSVEALHQAGIVHGALHARNIIVDKLGRPRLTQISPLLFDDPQVDERAASGMFAQCVDRRDDIDPSISQLLRGPVSLRQLASSLATSNAEVERSDSFKADDRARRKRLVFLAMGVTCLGLIIAVIAVLLSNR